MGKNYEPKICTYSTKILLVAISRLQIKKK